MQRPGLSRFTGIKFLHATSRNFSNRGIVPLIINGKDVETGVTFPLISPTTNKEAYACSAATSQHIKDVVDAAHKAFPAWAKTKPSHRRDIFLQAADIITRRSEELGEYMYTEIGANRFYKDFILGLAIEGLKDTAGRIAGAVTGFVPESIHEGTRAMVWKRPYGVNLGIAPWNAPFHLGLRSITFALATGNTAILKGSEFSPACYWAIADIFREAGLPDGCLNLVFHQPADAATTIESLVAHPAVKKINFTGSSTVGAIIASTAGKYLKPTLMELGGKASAIVCKDADIHKAAASCAMGAFVNAGQICMSTERILVHSSIAHDFRIALRKSINTMYGSLEQTPILVTAASAKRNRALVADALSKGAKTLDIFTENSEDHEKMETHMRPVVLTNINESMEIYRSESFGPSVSFYTFNSEQEAVELANDTEYGLSAAVFTENLGTGLRIAEALDSGAVHINSMTVHDEFSLPHGGVKNSGFGRFNGYQGLEEFLYYKSVTWMES
ncbi:putative aldehyde dehydrogenase [Xylariales sp. PMI_506]|nr:putative aldehyde dehydrogenase [Xylariales sp. PMI_506]